MTVDARDRRPYLLLTGATGLVGGMVLAKLIAVGIRVAVLVRGNRCQSAADRIELLMQRLEQRLGRTLIRPKLLAGELCQPDLSLAPADREWLTDNCSSVIHSAANLLFRPASEHPDNEPYRTNIDGTRNLLNVTTAAGIAEWHYVSTAYVAGMRTGQVFEQELNVGQEFANDYERSKTLAEEMLRIAGSIQSLTVYRPSIVIDLHPTSGMKSDQTINSAFAMFQALSQRFGLPERGEWFRRLGFRGDERKNIVTVDWVAQMIATISQRPALHGRTYHLTSTNGTPASALEDSFRAAVELSGVRLPVAGSQSVPLIDEQAAPFVAAFKPYFRDDPQFNRENSIRAMKTCGLSDLPHLSTADLRDFCLRQTKPQGTSQKSNIVPTRRDSTNQAGAPSRRDGIQGANNDNGPQIVIVGMACRVPGADDIESFAELLFAGRTGYGELPADRCDRSLYVDSRKGRTGTTYSTLGGTVPERPLDRDVCPLSPNDQQRSDVAHVQFAEVAATAWKNAGLEIGDSRFKSTGVYVGHSGGTKSGGGLSLGTQIEEALTFVDDLASFRQLPEAVRQQVIADVVQAVRHERPFRHAKALPRFHAYQAAALSALVLGLTGPRSVIDAACASSLVALTQAMMAMHAGRLDSAIVGGATYNSADNLILFSHSQACTNEDSRPFDDRASGLVSSEGYVAVVITTLERALRHDLPVLGVIRGVGMSSDGRGRSLWAPRMEGQILALQRAYSDPVPLLDIDYLETHATSTQLGDATELETLKHLLSSRPNDNGNDRRLPIGSVKSNIGHTLEAAGLIGLVKVLLAMQRGHLPPSLRFEEPNRNCDWGSAPFRVVTQTEEWPDHAVMSEGGTLGPDRPALRRSRRAAVSAFGIGGLNAHVVVEEPTAIATSVLGLAAEAGSAVENEAIAIVGRGVALAGAKSVDEFAALLGTDRSAIGEAPEDRWRRKSGVESSAAPQSYRTPHCRGGFITDFAFDGARYRIPPKQVHQANPVQVMLIDAVAQAVAEAFSIEDAKSSDWPLDRQKTGVVIGTIFGGEFGDQLQVGMRLPEICKHMTTAMQQQGVAEERAQQIAAEFRQSVLKHRPALLDETGSFTASTLASRVAKTFDLMGGACAIDSDDASGLAAVTVAMDQLRTGRCDLMVCGTAQRSMNLSAFESLDLEGRLVRSGRIDDVPDDCRQILPGEGVVALLLCRLSDAERLQLPVLGVFDDRLEAVNREPVGELNYCWPAAPPAGRRTEADRGLSPWQSGEFQPAERLDNSKSQPLSELPSLLNAHDAAIVRKVGYLCGAHSLVRIVAETLRSSNDGSALAIAAQTNDGIVIATQLIVKAATVAPKPSPVASPDDADDFSVRDAAKPVRVGSSGLTARQFRFGAPSGRELARLLRESAVRVDALYSRLSRGICRTAHEPLSPAHFFDAADSFRAVVLASSSDQLRERLGAAAKSAEAGKFRTLLDRDRVLLWQTDPAAETPRVAWLFPGQGAHYFETPSVFGSSEVARRTLATVDARYAAAGLPKLSASFGNSAIKPGQDVWWAQAWVLGVTAALTAALKTEGHHPDAVLGHSFGEFMAALAANVITLEQTIELARHRTDSVIAHMRTAGGLLSIRAAVHEVDAILKSAALPAFVTHLNSPKQTVIAGSRDGIAAAKLLLDSHSLASMSISVPTPFHTPLMADAETAFERLTAGMSLRPPVCGFLSATSVQYLAEPGGIRSSLVRQLTQPVLWVPAIRRMQNDGFRVFVEVGPNDVLTRLTRDTVGSDAICLSLDVPGQNYDERLALVTAVLECVTGQPSTPTSNSSGVETAGRSGGTGGSMLAAAASAPLIFDVTKGRRTARRPGHASDTVEPLALPHYEPTVYPTTSVVAYPSTEIPKLKPTRPMPLAAPNVRQPVRIADDLLRSFLRDLVVELTGYSPDVIDFDADLEADLGIDSIKKAQILGELGEWLGLAVRPDSLRMDSVRTLDDAIAVAKRLSEDSPGADKAGRTSSVGRQTVDVRSSVSGQLGREEASEGLHPPLAGGRGLDEMLIDYVVDQTGYDRAIVDLDADLEADLGLDSIKLAQLIGEMREQFDLQSVTLDLIAKMRFRTLREIRGFLQTHGADSVDVSASGRVAQASSGGVGTAQRISAPPRNIEEIRVASALPVPARRDNSSVPLLRSHSPDNTAKAVDRGLEKTHRFALRVLPAPRRAGMPRVPEIHGAALILGENSLARELAEAMRRIGHETIILDTSAPIAELESTLTELWKQSPTPHLFLTTAFDALAAAGLTETEWQRRRAAALEVPFRICQLWMQRTIDAGQMEHASVAAVTRLGGDFGFSGKQVQSIEAIGGLVKAMLIESWMAGFRTTPMKVIDASPELTTGEIAECVLQELTVPSYDMEIAFRPSADGGEPQRFSVQAVHAPLSNDQSITAGRPSRAVEIVVRDEQRMSGTPLEGRPTERSSLRNQITRGGTWIVSGGGRGITAVVAMELAEKHALCLQLLGTAPVPDLTADFVRAVADDRNAVRRSIMQLAGERSESPVEAWRNTEKAIEIDATLRACRERGITATYHCCDVSDFTELCSVVQRIRETEGPILGVIHGAGSGQDSRFDRKRPDKVDKCLRAKIDGSLALMHATQTDPLEWFVTFGSISGRFGANGHTDYSLANDMMAKIVDRYRSERPEVRSLTFHWHAWGDIGMATKPEAKLALEMIDMEFMPAREGIAHFLRELEFGGDEPEVLITDESYFRKFFPADRLGANEVVSEILPLLNPATSEFPEPKTSKHTGAADEYHAVVVTLNPVTDRFLSQHRIQGCPTLPFVVALEMMAEAARAHTGKPVASICTQARAVQAIRFQTDDPLAVTIQTSIRNDGAIECRLLADVRRRDGRMVEEDRLFFRANFVTRSSPNQVGELSSLAFVRPSTELCQQVKYAAPEALIWHGPELQELRQIFDDGQTIFGRIAASAPVQLFGADRARGFTVPCSTMDACLYAVGYAVWQRYLKPSLPVQFDRIEFGRLPDPGEPCLIRIQQTALTDMGATWDFQLQGLNGDRLLTVSGYQIAWLRAT